MRYLCVTSLLIFGCFSSLYAQQEPTYNLYRYTMNVLNPAYAGSNDRPEFVSNIRSQWSGIDGAPQTQSFALSTPINDKVGAGISVINDKVFIESQKTVFIDFSYRLTLNRELDLFLGLKAGGSFLDVDLSSLPLFGPIADPGLQDIENQFNPNIGIGAYLKGDRYYLSLSAPKILNTERSKTENGIATTATDKMHVYLSGGHDFDLNRNVVFSPSFMARYVNGSPLSVDLTTMVGFNERYEVGAAYRFSEAFSLLTTINIVDWLDFGYAYEFSSQSELSAVNNGTHEFLLRFRLERR